jgi:hypothetical protein
MGRGKNYLFFAHNLKLTFLPYGMQFNWNFFNYFVKL